MMYADDARQKTIEALRAVETFKTPAQRLDSWMRRVLLAAKEIRDELGIPPPSGAAPERGAGPAARSLRSGQCCDGALLIGPHRDHARIKFKENWNGPPLFHKGDECLFPAALATGLVSTNVAAWA